MNFCCEDMQAHVRIVTEHTAQLCDGEAISYLPQFHEYGIPCGMAFAYRDSLLPVVCKAFASGISS